MSAIITLPPVLIDSTYFSRMTFTEQGQSQGRIMASGGPWLVGSNQYMFLEGGGVVSGIVPLWVYKSTDNGNTWIAMDTASSNLPPTPTNDPSQNTSVFDPISGKIFVAYMGDGSTHRLRIYTFNTSTDLWESPGTQSTNDSQNSVFVMARQSSGDIYCFYVNPSTFVTVYEKYSGGTWSLVTVDANTDGHGVESVIVDSSDRMHLTYQRGGTTRLLQYVQISSSGVVGTPVNLYTNASAGFGGGFGVGRGVIWGTKIVFPVFIYGGATVTPLVFEGTPIATPSWSSRTAGTGVTAPAITTGLDSLLDKDGNLVVGWNDTHVVTSAGDKIWINTDSGSGFAGQLLFYDGVTNPLNVPGITVQSGVHSLYLTQDSSGDWFALTAVDMDSDLGFPCGGIFLTSLGASNPPTLSCPIGTTAQVGVPYTGMLLASGGTPPYTYAIIA